MPRETPEERRLHAKHAAHISWANASDPSERTAPARATFNRRFEDQVDPNRELPEAERARRAESLRRAYFTKLALRSAKSRRANARTARSAAIDTDVDNAMVDGVAP